MTELQALLKLGEVIFVVVGLAVIEGICFGAGVVLMWKLLKSNPFNKIRGK